MRAINKRGTLVSERLAWTRSVVSDKADASWLDEGEAIVGELRAAMHGELDPRRLDESIIRDWQRVGWAIEAEAAAEGRPPINAWLDDPAAQAHASEVATGSSLLNRPPHDQFERAYPTEFDSARWLDEAAIVCTNEFEPAAERMLQLGTLKVLGLDSFDVLGGDVPAMTVGNSRLGYALRNRECQQIPSAREVRDDRLAAELDDCDASPYTARSVWLPRVVHDLITEGDHGGVDGMFESLPGVPSQMRHEVLSLWGDRWSSDDPYTGRDATRWLMLFGYLLHYVYELRPELLAD